MLIMSSPRQPKTGYCLGSELILFPHGENRSAEVLEQTFPQSRYLFIELENPIDRERRNRREPIQMPSLRSDSPFPVFTHMAQPIFKVSLIPVDDEKSEQQVRSISSLQRQNIKKVLSVTWNNQEISLNKSPYLMGISGDAKPYVDVWHETKGGFDDKAIGVLKKYTSRLWKNHKEDANELIDEIKSSGLLGKGLFSVQKKRVDLTEKMVFSGDFLLALATIIGLTERTMFPEFLKQLKFLTQVINKNPAGITFEYLGVSHRYLK